MSIKDFMYSSSFVQFCKYCKLCLQWTHGGESYLTGYMAAISDITMQEFSFEYYKNYLNIFLNGDYAFSISWEMDITSKDDFNSLCEKIDGLEEFVKHI